VILPILPLSFIYCSIHSNKFPFAVMTTVLPLTFIHTPIRPCENTNSMVLPIYPISRILRPFWSYKCSLTMVLPFIPMTFKSLQVVESKDAVSMSISFNPVSLILATISVYYHTLTSWISPLQRSFILRPIWKLDKSFIIDIVLARSRIKMILLTFNFIRVFLS
jgi:hypothetical protein